MSTRRRSARLLLDEHISPRVAVALRRGQIDAHALAEPDYEDVRGMSDLIMLEKAVAQKRVIVTYNYADFIALHKDWVLKAIDHFGIALVARGQVPAGDRRAQIHALRLFAEKRASYKNELMWIP